ncbi:hypothetical protein JW960_05980 [candidate division KSB1 bacterium]|nr:hypothetical protein [candidate division KSB1 bacterium]
MIRKIFTIICIFLMSASIIHAQSGREFRRHSVMRGNLVKTVYGNWGVIGQPSEVGDRGAWIYDNNGYIGDVSPFVGVEVMTADSAGQSKKFHSVITSPVARPTLNNELSPKGSSWTFEPRTGYANDKQEGIALYSDPASWPAYWPDKLSDSDDPGWANAWNGFFGKTTTASEETYFVMDDNNDEEFNYANYNRWGVNFKPDSTDTFRNGMGLIVKVRAMQWRDFLAQDNIFWLYEITNTSTTDYAQVVFGMLVGTYIGVSSTEDFREYDDDYSFYDVEQDIVFTADFDDNCSRNPLWTDGVGVVGYAFLESPGNEHDGIDNDGDANMNPEMPSMAPFFTEDDFTPRTFDEGDIIITINNRYERTQVVVPEDEFEMMTRGLSEPISIEPGFTKLVEGNIVKNADGIDVVNPNAYDGIDNDLDGLIDENFYLHYRQLRRDANTGKILIDKLSPVRYKDYINNIGLSDVLIDEGRADGIDNDGDWDINFDDVGADGIAGTGDYGEKNGAPTLGEPNFDRTDVDESDQIGLTSFQYFTPAREIDLSDDEELWQRMSPGLFEVPASIVNNKPIQGEDGDFVYGSGYFPLLAGETKWFSLALVYGEGGGPQVDIVDLMKNRKTVQQIYDNDYRFPPAPDKPTLTVVPGDGKVTLYWDRKAEMSFDPVLKEYDFEGYKIFKATDHNFNDVFQITDADGIVTSYKPLAQYDLNDGVKGYFYPANDLFQDVAGFTYNLGSDTGLQHSFVDTDVENGRRYFYAVVAYDKGNSANDIFPKENDFRIEISPSGEVKTFQNTGYAIPNAPAAGYDEKVAPDSSVYIAPITAVGTGNVYYKEIDDQAVDQRYQAAVNDFQSAPKYRIGFWDTSNDGVDNDHDWNSATDDVGSDGIPGTHDADNTEGNGIPDVGEPNLDLKDPDEAYVPITSFYRVRDLVGIKEKFTSRDTFVVRLTNSNLVDGTIEVKDPNGAIVDTSNYLLNAELGTIRGKSSRSLLYGAPYTITYQYYPVYKSPYIEDSPYETETKDTDIFDGIRILFQNDWTIKIDKQKTGWSNPAKALDYTMKAFDTYYDDEHIIGKKHPSDYEIEFFDQKVYNTYDIPSDPSDKSVSVNFKIFNITDNKYVDFTFVEIDDNQKLSDLDRVILLESNGIDTVFTWEFTFIAKDSTTHDYGSGDKLTIVMDKPFRNLDTFEFGTVQPEIKKLAAQEQLDQIKVVPNPYIAATSHELPLPPAITSGRGDRKIDFIHLPVDAEIMIFTARGEHVITLNNENSMHDGSVTWNLKTKENLDIAPGIYFYVVKSPVGDKRGKLAVIK